MRWPTWRPAAAYRRLCTALAQASRCQFAAARPAAVPPALHAALFPPAELADFVRTGACLVHPDALPPELHAAASETERIRAFVASNAAAARAAGSAAAQPGASLAELMQPQVNQVLQSPAVRTAVGDTANSRGILPAF